jgi:tetratricopeptide (TPR) repeat protein
VLKAAGDANSTLILFPAASAWIDTAAADSLGVLGRNDEALQALDRARAAREIPIKANPAVTRNREKLFRIHRQAADIHRRTGRMPEALAVFEQTAQVLASLVRDHPESDYQADLAWAYIDLGALSAETGKSSEMLSYFDKATAIRRKILESNPSVA